MRGLSQKELEEFQKAILDDYGLTLESSELYQVAFNLLKFVEALIKFDKEDKNKQNDQKVRKLS